MEKTIPTFEIFRADGSKVPTLIKSFLVKEYIHYGHMIAGKMQLEDTSVWNLMLTPEIDHILMQEDISSVFCIVSYQVHTHGNYAIARLVKGRETRDIAVSDINELEGQDNGNHTRF